MNVPFPPVVEIRECPQFRDLVGMIRLIGPDVCSDMAGSLYFLGLMEPPLRLLMLLRLLAPG